MKKLNQLLSLLLALVIAAPEAAAQAVHRTVGTFDELIRTKPERLAADGPFRGAGQRATVQTQGYYAPGDGGGALYRLTTATANTNIHGGRALGLHGGAWELIHDGTVNLAAFGAVGRPQDTIPPYWSQESFSTAIGTGDMTLWARFVTPTFTEFAQGLMRIKTTNSFSRLFGVSVDEDYVMVDLISTAGLNDAGAGLTTSAGYWFAANPFTTPGETNELAVVRVGDDLTVYVNGSPLAGTYVNQQAFGEEFCATTGNFLEVGQGWKPDLYDNELWWRDRIIEARVWNSAVTSGWSAAGSALATTTQDETDLEDFAPNIQAAIDWLWLEGGGTVVLPQGVVRIDSGLTMRPNVNFIGLGAGQYSQDRNPIGRSQPGASTLLPWYGFTDNGLSMIAENGITNGTPLLNNVTASDLTYVTEYNFPIIIEKFHLDMSLAERGNAIHADRVGSWTVRDLQIFAPQGSPVYAYGCNAFFIQGIKGAGKARGFYMASSADYTVEGCLWGSVRASTFWGQVANKGTIGPANHLFNALPQRTGYATVDAGTDVFTLPKHRLSTGDAVVFDANGGTLPSPIDTRATYYVYRIDADTFKVNTQRGQGAVGGALQGVGIDITTAGSGSWRVLNGWSVNLSLAQSDNVNVVGNRFDQSFRESIRASNLDNSDIAHNLVSEHGYNGETNVAAILLTNGSTTNTLSDNTIDRRSATSKGEIGLHAESGSRGNVFRGAVDASVTHPYWLDENVNWIDPSVKYLQTGNFITANAVLATTATSGFLGVPSMGGAPSGTPTPSNGTIPFAVDFSNSRTLYYIGGGWRYGALSDNNKILTYTQPTSGTRAAQFITDSSDATLNIYNYGGAAGQGASFNGFRALGTAASPTSVPANYSVSEWSASPYHSGGNWHFNSGYLNYRTSQDQTGTAAGIELDGYVTANDELTPRQWLRVHNLGYLILRLFTSDPATLIEGGIWYNSTDQAWKYREAGATRTLVAAAKTQTLSAKTLSLSAALGTDDTLEGTQITGLNNSGGVTQWDAVYLNASSQWVLADANGSGTYPAVGLATATVSTGNATSVLVTGTVRNDAWNWTPGGAIYLSTTAGGLTQTAPSGMGDAIHPVGRALTADIAFFHFNPAYELAP